MRFRIVFLICFTLAAAASLAAQTRSVSNANLEQYKQDRLKGEREYRDNYARLGLPSPEELDRRREQSRIETEQLSAKLREENLERERLESQRRANARRPVYVYVEPGSPLFDQVFFSSFVRSHGRPMRHGFSQQGYFGGGQFWPTGPRTPPQPMFVPQRH